MSESRPTFKTATDVDRMELIASALYDELLALGKRTRGMDEYEKEHASRFVLSADERALRTGIKDWAQGISTTSRFQSDGCGDVMPRPQDVVYVSALPSQRHPVQRIRRMIQNFRSLWKWHEFR